MAKLKIYCVKCKQLNDKLKFLIEFIELWSLYLILQKLKFNFLISLNELKQWNEHFCCCCCSFVSIVQYSHWRFSAKFICLLMLQINFIVNNFLKSRKPIITIRRYWDVVWYVKLNKKNESKLFQWICLFLVVCSVAHIK